MAFCSAFTGRRAFSTGVMVLSALVVLASGCGGHDQEHPEIPQRILRIVDSIGTGLEDPDFGFGSIDRVCFGPDGSILALDRISCCIRCFDPEGTSIGVHGARGSGPGEYLNPSDMAVLGDGRVIVCDVFSGGVHLLDTDLVDQGVRIPLSSDPPFSPVGTTDSSFVAGLLGVEVLDDAISATYRVARFELSDEAACTYYSKTWMPDPTDFTGIVDEVLHSVTWAADPEGNVYIAPMTIDKYEVTGYREDGTEFFRVSMPVERVARTPEEIAEEKAFIDARLTSLGSSLDVDYQPSPWRYQIRQLEVDGDGNVWVLRGTEITPAFDVFDPQGTRIFTATVQGAGEDGLYWRFTIDEAGILAWSDDPLDCPKIYLLELQ